ncbi:hypothetical protein TL16_g13102 [Triparma laevis f. inornata]|uniref:Uncharacterized protein n=1 Tax=Triparma laevis f. inornata TaxID=1714386 RepID=A0A9W7EXA7_9STRA|nr:hypothetical protein TL16_g13102 [Triparma laevis f. inornata]
MSTIISSLSSLEIQVSDKISDHICYRTSTSEEYTTLTTAFNSCPSSITLLIESVIGGRMISTYKLSTPIPCDEHQIELLELPSPKSGSPYPSGLEHVEFVIPSSCTSPSAFEFDHESVLRRFASEHPLVEWSFKATKKR